MAEEPRLPRLGPDDVPPATRERFEAFLRQRGKIPNLFRIAAHRPSIHDTLAAHLAAVMGPGEVSMLLKELLSVRVSHHNECEY